VSATLVAIVERAESSTPGERHRRGKRGRKSNAIGEAA